MNRTVYRRPLVALLLLVLAWPHAILPLVLSAVLAVLGLIAAHLPLALSIAAAVLLLRSLPRRWAPRSGLGRLLVGAR
ncbi:hypothetical protein ACWCQN_24370 [Streptomyces sp. NPDC001984]